MLVSRQTARSMYLKRYFTGRPCPRGHISERFTHNCRCVECNRVDTKQHYQNNRQELLELRARFAELNVA